MAAPAKRSPGGFVAQQLWPGKDRPWLLAQVDEYAQLRVEVLTDEQVVDWPDMLDVERPAVSGTFALPVPVPLPPPPPAG